MGMQNYTTEHRFPFEKVDTSLLKTEERPARLDTRAYPVMVNELENLKGREKLNTERYDWQKTANKETKTQRDEAIATVKAAEALPENHAKRKEIIAGAKAKAEKLNEAYDLGLKHLAVYAAIRDQAKKHLAEFDHERLAALKNLAAIEAAA